MNATLPQRNGGQWLRVFAFLSSSPYIIVYRRAKEASVQ